MACLPATVTDVVLNLHVPHFSTHIPLLKTACMQISLETLTALPLTEYGQQWHSVDVILGPVFTTRILYFQVAALT